VSHLDSSYVDRLKRERDQWKAAALERQSALESVHKKLWSECSHDWQTPVDSMFSNEKFGEVFCKECGCPGEMTWETKQVYWPAT
jgi:hypothetical protein